MTGPEIVGFLHDRIAETEADARTAIESDLDQWGATQFEIRYVSPDSIRGDGLGATVAHTVTSKPAAHIARHDPALVLADCAFKRAMLNQILIDLADDPTDETAQFMACSMASIYADHPDFDPTWKVAP